MLQSTLKFCTSPACNSVLSEDADFCRDCGTKWEQRYPSGQATFQRLAGPQPSLEQLRAETGHELASMRAEMRAQEARLQDLLRVERPAVERQHEALQSGLQKLRADLERQLAALRSELQVAFDKCQVATDAARGLDASFASQRALDEGAFASRLDALAIGQEQWFQARLDGLAASMQAQEARWE